MFASVKYFRGQISIRGILNQPTLEFLGVIAAPLSLLLSELTFQGHLDNYIMVPKEGLYVVFFLLKNNAKSLLRYVTCHDVFDLVRA